MITMTAQTKTVTKDDVFGFILATKKSYVQTGKSGAYRYAFLVKTIGSDQDAAWYNAIGSTPKAINYLDGFTKGKRVGLNLTKNQNFNDIANIHHASSKKN